MNYWIMYAREWKRRKGDLHDEWELIEMLCVFARVWRWTTCDQGKERDKAQVGAFGIIFSLHTIIKHFICNLSKTEQLIE